MCFALNVKCSTHASLAPPFTNHRSAPVVLVILMGIDFVVMVTVGTSFFLIHPQLWQLLEQFLRENKQVLNKKCDN